MLFICWSESMFLFVVVVWRKLFQWLICMFYQSLLKCIMVSVNCALRRSDFVALHRISSETDSSVFIPKTKKNKKWREIIGNLFRAVRFRTLTFAAIITVSRKCVRTSSQAKTKNRHYRMHEPWLIDPFESIISSNKF